MERVWGENGLHGEPEEYAWLTIHYGITEEEDVQWQLVLQYSDDDLPQEDKEDEDVMNFLEDDDAIASFLKNFLQKYKSNNQAYPR
jgi:hypothetical protein